MDLTTECQVCGQRIAKFACKHCGKQVCEIHFNPSLGICSECTAKIKEQ